jgi:sugar lactone lactonase YvrE
MNTLTSETILEGIVFPEGPRWHDGDLWFSDMHAHRVMKMSPQGRAEVVVEVPTRPSGLGFDGQGRLLVVSMTDRKLLRFDDGRKTELADLSPFCGGDANDMVVDGHGRAYVGNFGFDLFAGGGEPRPTNLVLVLADGSARVVASDLVFPNGTVITPDGRTLIVAESFASRLTAFDVADDGSLSGRRIFAALGERTPDGICLDAEGAVWVSCFGQDEFVRVLDGGEITHRIPVSGRRAVACMLGGADRRTLYLLTAETSVEELAEGKSKGRIETARVEVPGAGWP